jgi:hypothetical protein
MKPLKIYIAGPYTKGDVALNVRNAVYAGNLVAHFGHFPFIPHLSHFWHMLTPHEDIEFWYKQDIEWLKVCDALLRIEGESKGADEEERIAREMGIPIYYSVFEIPRMTDAEKIQP